MISETRPLFVAGDHGLVWAGGAVGEGPVVCKSCGCTAAATLSAAPAGLPKKGEILDPADFPLHCAVSHRRSSYNQPTDKAGHRCEFVGEGWMAPVGPWVLTLLDDKALATVARQGPAEAAMVGVYIAERLAKAA